MSKVARRKPWRKRSSEENDKILGKLRVGELIRLFMCRYGGSREGWQFPQNADAYESLKVLIQHYRRSNPWKMAQIIKIRAPWADVEEILSEVEQNSQGWTAADLGRELGFTGEEWRQMSPPRLKTITPYDMSAEERRDYS